MPVLLEASRVGRYPQDTESTVYFWTLEALANVAKHARASRETVSLSGSDDALEFSVRDDGRASALGPAATPACRACRTGWPRTAAP